MTTQTAASPITPDPATRKKFAELSGVNVSLCYQCQKCTNGCPVAFAMDVPPHRVMRLLHLGQVDTVLGSDTIWTCASCETCTTRCHNGIDIAHVMDRLRQLARENKAATHAQKEALLFHTEFLRSVKQYGRVHEMGMVTRYTIKSKGLFGYLKQSALGMTMVLKGKLKPLPHSLKGSSEVRAIFKQAEEKTK